MAATELGPSPFNPYLTLPSGVTWAGFLPTESDGVEQPALGPATGTNALLQQLHKLSTALKVMTSLEGDPLAQSMEYVADPLRRLVLHG